jgi:hypothetical protein
MPDLFVILCGQMYNSTNGPIVSVNNTCKSIPDTLSPVTCTRLHLKQLVIPALTNTSNTLCLKAKRSRKGGDSY